MPVIEQKTTNKNKVDFDLNRLDKSKTTIFSKYPYLKLFPNDENYTCEILDATMILKEDCIYWCDCGGLSVKDLESYAGTTICASKVRWRAADEFIGSNEIYVTI